MGQKKIWFAKTPKHNFSTEIIRVANVIDRRPRPVYELEDLNSTLIDNQFYREELTPLRITVRTAYKIDKVLYKRFRRGIREYLIRWRG